MCFYVILLQPNLVRLIFYWKYTNDALLTLKTSTVDNMSPFGTWLSHMVDKAAVTHVNTDPKISEKCFQHLVEFMPQNTLAVRKNPAARCSR